MDMAAPIDFYTADMVRELNERAAGSWPRYETANGELLVSSAPRAWHQEIVRRLLLSISHYLEVERIGHPFASPADISWGLRDVLLQPDIFVVPVASAKSLDWSIMRELLLAIEVASPSSTRADRFTKRLIYQRHHTECYWVVDPEERVAEVWLPDDLTPQTASDQLTWMPRGAALPLVLSLEELFAPI
jgi:Uma2 family endonuclease